MGTSAALILVSGQPKRIAAGDTLLVGDGISAHDGHDLIVGNSSYNVTFPGNVVIDGNVTFTDGTTISGGVTFTEDVTFGDAIAPDTTVSYHSTTRTSGDIIFKKEETHNLIGADSTTSAASGASLYVVGGGGTDADATHTAGPGGGVVSNGGFGGTGDNAHAKDGGAGGQAQISGGQGGAGGVDIAAGTGGYALIQGGDAGADNDGDGANGGQVGIQVGLGKGTLGVNGVINIGTSPAASQMTIGQDTTPITINGGSIILCEDKNTLLELDGSLVQPHVDIQFTDLTSHQISFGTAASTVAGKHISIIGQEGGAGGVSGAGGTGGDAWLLGGMGGIASDGNHVGGNGGAPHVTGGTGGNGDGDQPAGVGGNVSITGGEGGAGTDEVLSSSGGSVYIYGGNSGADGGADRGDAGSVIIDAGVTESPGSVGTVEIGTVNAAAVHIGSATAATVSLNAGTLTFYESGTLRLAITGGLVQPACDIQFTDTGHRAIKFPTADDATTGKNITVQAQVGGIATAGSAAGAGGASYQLGGTGGAAAAGHAAGVGGNSYMTGGIGGTATSGASETAAAGGLVRMTGGTGGSAGPMTNPAGAGGAAQIYGGNAGWAGAAGGNNGGDVLLQGGAATGNGNGGSVTINAGPGAGSGFTGSIWLQSNGTSRLCVTAGGYLTVQAGALLNTTGTGNIDLPNNVNARFKIETAAVSANVTAANLTELTGGGVTALHTHAGGTGTDVSITVTAGETLPAGSTVYMKDSTGPKGFKAIADGSVAGTENVIGIAKAEITTTGAVAAVGEVAVPNTQWDSTPATGDVGKVVYLSPLTAGKLTLTAPDTIGLKVLKVGILTVGGSGACKIAVQIGVAFTA